jgi:hypothetical protein
VRHIPYKSAAVHLQWCTVENLSLNRLWEHWLRVDWAYRTLVSSVLTMLRWTSFSRRQQTRHYVP